MIYAIKYHNFFSGEERIATGGSIPHAIERGKMLEGYGFTGNKTEYGIQGPAGEFIRIPELDEPGHYTPEKLDQILNDYYKKAGG